MKMVQKTSVTLKLRPFWSVVFTMFAFIFLVSPAKAQQVRIGSGVHFVNGTNVIVNGDAMVNNGTIKNKATGMIKLSGNWQNDGAFSSETGSVVTLDGSAVQVIGGSSQTTFGTLSLNNSAGFSMVLNTTVNGTLDFQNGIISTGSNILSIGSSGTVTGASSTAYVNGKLARSIGNSGIEVAFPIGTGGNYRPLSVNFSSLTGTSTVLAEQIESLMPGSVPDNVTFFPDRYWVISQTGGSNMAFTLTLNGNGFTPSTIKKMIKGDGSANSVFDVTFSSPNYTNSSPFNSFSNFGLGEYCVPPVVPFDALDAKTYGDAPFMVSSIGGGSGSPVIFTSSDPTVASCTGTNGTTITILKAGTCTITATQAGDENYCQGHTDRVLTINPKPITVMADAGQTKVYGSADPSSFTYTLSPSLVGTDAITGLMGRNSGENAGNYAFTLGTLAAGANYTLSVSLTSMFTITPKPLTPAITASGKCYDGNVTAALTSQTLTGIIAPEVVTLSVTSSVFDNATAGPGKTVTASGLSLGGAGASNYTLASSTATTTADIYLSGQVNQPSDQFVCNSASGGAVTFATTNTGGTPSYEWTNDIPSIGLAASGTGNIPSFTAINSGMTPVMATIVVTPTYTTGAVSCMGPSISFTITVNSAGQVNQPSSEVLCNGSSTTAVTFGTGITGGTTTYAWSNDTPGIGLASSGTGNIAPFTAINTGTSPVVATIVATPTFTNGGVGCTGPTKTFTITVNPTGQVNQPASEVLCNGSSTTAVTFGTGNTGGTTTYAWTNDTPGIGLAASGTGNIASFAAVNTGTSPLVASIVVTPTFTNGGVSCTGPTKTFTISVNPTGQVNQPPSEVLCNGSSTTAVTFGTGNTGGTTTYAWTNDATSIGLAASGTGNIASFTALNSGSSPVIATILVTPTFTNGGVSCSGPTKTFTITVNPTGQVNQPASEVLCNGSSTAAVTFGTVNTGGTTTYAWTNNATSIGLAASGTGNIASFTTVNTGTSPVVATIVVTPTFTNGGVSCTGPAKTFTITVNPTGQVNQPASEVLCNGSSTTAVTFGTVNTGGTTTYAWTNNATSIGLAASGTGNIASFTAVNTGTLPVVATIVVTPTFTNGGVSCTGPTKTFTITVNPTGQVNQPASEVLCNGSSTTAITFGTGNTGGTTTYAWTNNTTSIGLAALGTGNIASFTAVNTGTWPVIATIVVTPTFTNGSVSCAGPTKTFTITVNPTGQVNQPANQALCHNTNSTAVIFGTVNNGGTTTYTWTNNNASIGLAASGSGNIPSFTALNPGTTPVVATIVVTPTFTNAGVSCTGPTKTFTITVYPLPVPTITGSNNLCVNSGYYNYATEPGMTGYVWTLSAGGTITWGAGTNQIQVVWNTPGAQTVTVIYTNPFGCGTSAPTIIPVTVNPMPGNAGNITGPAAVCAGSQGVSYSTVPIANAVTYVWNLPAGATIATGSGTPNITVNFASNASSGNISVNGNNLCGNGNSSSLMITFTLLPDPAGSISGNTSVCEGDQGVAYSVNPIANATGYLWNLPAGAVIASGANTNAITVDFGITSGSISVKGTNSCGEGSLSPVLAVVVNPIPPAPVVTAMDDTLHSSASMGNQWYFSATQSGTGVIITGATEQTYQATQTGWYWNVVTLGGCSSDTSNHVYILMVGTEELRALNILVYPVPNRGIFTVSVIAPVEKLVAIQIFNMSGQMIWWKNDLKVSGTLNQQIDLTPIPPGVYSVLVTEGTRKIVRRVVIGN